MWHELNHSLIETYGAGGTRPKREKKIVVPRYHGHTDMQCSKSETTQRNTTPSTTSPLLSSNNIQTLTI